MNDQSWMSRFFKELSLRITQAKQRSRPFFPNIWEKNHTENAAATENTALRFLEQYHCSLFAQQTQLQTSDNTAIFPLKRRSAELILKQVNVYYLPNRLESLLPYCDPFTAVATFLNALNLSYETLIQDPQKQQLCQSIFKELMAIDESHNLETSTINEFPLYEGARTHNLEEFKTTAFAFKRALDIIELLEQRQPRHYQKQQHQLAQFWHQKSNQELEKIVQRLTQ
ncbi:MAG: hypothetical protein BRC33_06040 [Cyanobacteria bacterium SW_9_44_58]|nr:MAG: hypothetical protein BRC33_06040 [Cyanobacteria bacterium SW_9_44_58]